MSKLTDKKVQEAKEIFAEAYRLYQEEKYQEALTKYQEVLSLIEKADEVAGKVTVYTAIAQVCSKLGESEMAKSEEFNTKAIELLRQIKPTDFKTLHQLMSPIRDELMMGGTQPDPIDPNPRPRTHSIMGGGHGETIDHKP